MSDPFEAPLPGAERVTLGPNLSLIDLSWASNDLVGLSCPFCRVVLDWEMLKRRIETDIEPELCNHLNFASTECLPFDSNGVQLSKQSGELGNLFRKLRAVNVRMSDAGLVWDQSPIDTVWSYIENIVSDLQERHYYTRKGSSYDYYLGTVSQTLKLSGQGLYIHVKNMALSLGGDFQEAYWDEVGEYQTVLEESILPNANDDQTRYEIERFESKESGLFESLLEKNVGRGDDFWKGLNPPNIPSFFDWATKEQVRGQVIIFTAPGALSDKCWCAVYSSDRFS